MPGLLPPNATPLEIAVEASVDRTTELDPGIVALRDLKDEPTADVAPFLMGEYGLEDIREFFPAAAFRDAIDEGLIWRRQVGTPEAVRRALAWVGYQATIEDQWIGRRRWHTFQFRFPALPGNDAPDLSHVGKIAEISTPLRSKFRRGYFQYDVTALAAESGRLDDAMLDVESGHALAAGGPLWSFGRTTQIEHLYTEDDGAALDNWIEPTGEDSLAWEAMGFPWSEAAFPWEADAAVSRRIVLAGWFGGKSVHACLRDIDGDVIGYCRCRAARIVRVKVGGPYTVGATSYEPVENGERFYAAARTPFGVAANVTARSVSLVVGGEPAAGFGPGAQWLGPGDLIGGAAFASTPVNLPLRATVRDHIQFLVRF